MAGRSFSSEAIATSVGFEWADMFTVEGDLTGVNGWVDDPAAGGTLEVVAPSEVQPPDPDATYGNMQIDALAGLDLSAPFSCAIGFAVVEDTFADDTLGLVFGDQSGAAIFAFLSFSIGGGMSQIGYGDTGTVNDSVSIPTIGTGMHTLTLTSTGDFMSVSLDGVALLLGEPTIIAAVPRQVSIEMQESSETPWYVTGISIVQPPIVDVFFDGGDNTWHVTFATNVAAQDFTGSVLSINGTPAAWLGNAGNHASYAPVGTDDASQPYTLTGLPPPFLPAYAGQTDTSA